MPNRKKIISTLLSASVAIALLSTLSLAEGKTQWGYTGHGSPEAWGELSPEYKICSMGKNQSPVNVTTSLDADLAAIAPEYTSASKEILNNGHTIQVNVEAFLHTMHHPNNRPIQATNARMIVK